MFDTLVIGAGQAGLAASYYLKLAGLHFAVLEAGAAPTGSWSQYYESLQLFSPTRHSSLPRYPFPGPSDHYPHRDEVCAYLQSYAHHFQFHILYHQEVSRVERAGSGLQVMTAAGERYQARTIIAANGPFHQPALPPFLDMAPGCGSAAPLVFVATSDSNPVLDTGRYQSAIATGRPDWRPLFERLTPQGVVWTEGHGGPVDSIILATGYRFQPDYLAGLGAWNAQGQVLQWSGRSLTVPGLFYVGLSFQRTYASAALRGVGPDAALAVRQFQRSLQATRHDEQHRRLLISLLLTTITETGTLSCVLLLDATN